MIRWSRYVYALTRECSSQSLKPCQDRRIRPSQGRSATCGVINGLRLFDGLSLHFEIQGGVAVSRDDTGVAKPLTDRDDVDARAQ